jgi:hypothetical protein
MMSPMNTTSTDAALRTRIVDAIMALGATETVRTAEQVAADDADVETLLAAKCEIDAQEPATVALPKAMRILRRRGL